MKKDMIRIAAVLPVLLFTVLPAFAQGPPPVTPIDGGLSLLLAAGGAYGLNKIYNARKKNRD